MWEVAEAYVKEIIKYDRQLKSYEKFLYEYLPNAVEEISYHSIEIGGEKIEITIDEFDPHEDFVKPIYYDIDGAPKILLPVEAKLKKRNYYGSINLKVKMYRNGQKEDEQIITVTDIPVMVKSVGCWLYGCSEEELIKYGEDPLDPGGYFIVNGYKRVLVSQDETAYNQISILKGEKPTESAIAHIPSKGRHLIVKLRIVRNKLGIWSVLVPLLPPNFPLIGLLYALGMKNEDILNNLHTDLAKNDALLNIEQCPYKNKKEALLAIGGYGLIGAAEDIKIARAEQILDGHILPHIGNHPSDRRTKAEFLLMMAEMTTEAAYGLRQFVDKDHLANKRIEMAGELLDHLVRTAFKNLFNDVRHQIVKTLSRRGIVKLKTIFKLSKFTDTIQVAMAQGIWSTGKTGISQLIHNRNLFDVRNDLGKVVLALKPERANLEAREVHGTQYGRLCPIQTPEQKKCGLHKYLAIGAYISSDADEKVIEKTLQKLGVNFLKKR
jgi:DNA-directed RNA polymerase beta subunit